MRIQQDDITWKVVSAEINKRIAELVDELTSSIHKHDAETDAARRTKLFQLRDLMEAFTTGVPNE